MIRVPANYPPVTTGARTLSGMGTPDLLGSYGTFTLYTDDEHWRGARASGGRIMRLDVTDHRACGSLTGPPNSLRASRPDLAREFCVDVDPEHDSARITAGDEAVPTGSGAIAGRPAYRSPEQARGELTDGRTDVYSLGIVLYEILAVHLPFEGETTMGVLMMHINEPPAPVPGLPPALQNVLDRALAKDVDDRFQTPAEFGEAFNMAIQGKADFATLDVLKPKTTRKTSKRIFKEKKKRPAWIMPVLAVVLIIAVAAGFMFNGLFQLPFGAASTSTSTLTISASVPAPSNTAARTATAVPALLLGRNGVLQFKDASATADQAVLVRTKSAPR